MKTLTKITSVLALVAIMTSSCSVSYKTRHRRHNVIDVGMNEKKIQDNKAASVAVNNDNGKIPMAGKYLPLRS